MQETSAGSSTPSQGEPDNFIARPFRGPRPFLQNAAIGLAGRELRITDRDGRTHHFNLDDGRGPYSAKFLKGRLLIVDGEGRAVLVTRAHLWDLGELSPLIFGLPATLEAPLKIIPRDDAVVMTDRQPSDLIPGLALGPFMVAPFVLHSLNRAGAVSDGAAILGGVASLVIVVVCGFAVARRSRWYQISKVRRKTSKTIEIIDERGDVATQIDLRGVARLRLKRSPDTAALLGFEVATDAELVGPDGEVKGEDFTLALRASDLLRIAKENGLTLEVVPDERVALDKTIALKPYGKRGPLKLAVRGDELVVTDRSGTSSAFPLTGPEAPTRIALTYSGYPYFPDLLAGVAVIDGRDRVILETPLRWWDKADKGRRSIFALARQLDVPVEVIDGRRRTVARTLAADGVRYVERPVVWYALGIASSLIAPFLAYVVVYAIHEYVTELTEGLMTTVSVLALGGWFLTYSILSVTRGTFRVWSTRG